MRRLSFNGIHLYFSEEELKRLMKSNERITRKEIAEYFGVLSGIIQKYMNHVKSIRYAESEKMTIEK